MFKHVLSFLRTPTVAAFTNAGTLSTVQFLSSFGESELQLLRAEADFFGIDGLTAAADVQLAKLASKEVEQIFAGAQRPAPASSRAIFV